MTQAGLDPLAWLDDRAAAREAAGLRRRLRPRSAGDDLLDLAGNDYLGLSRHPAVVAAAVAAAREWGAGSTGSRLVTGSTDLHRELEAALATHVGGAASLVFSSGYLANIAAVTALVGRGDLVVSDEYNHASLIDACRLSRARIVIAPHRDTAAVARALEDRDEERALVVTDAVFSVDGDRARLAELHTTCRAHAAVLLVDEAHSVGVVGDGGRGSAYDDQLAAEPDLVRTVTLSKALGSQGGAVVASQRVVDHLVDAARSFIFDTALAPPCAAAALAALRLLAGEPGLAGQARRHAAAIHQTVAAAGLASSPPDAAVVSARIGSPEAAVAAAAACAEHGVRVGCFRPPSVPDGVSRLRITARADLSAADVSRLGTAIAAIGVAG